MTSYAIALAVGFAWGVLFARWRDRRERSRVIQRGEAIIEGVHPLGGRVVFSSRASHYRVSAKSVGTLGRFIPCNHGDGCKLCGELGGTWEVKLG